MTHHEIDHARVTVLHEAAHVVAALVACLPLSEDVAAAVCGLNGLAYIRMPPIDVLRASPREARRTAFLLAAGPLASARAYEPLGHKAARILAGLDAPGPGCVPESVRRELEQHDSTGEVDLIARPSDIAAFGGERVPDLDRISCLLGETAEQVRQSICEGMILAGDLVSMGWPAIEAVAAAIIAGGGQVSRREAWAAFEPHFAGVHDIYRALADPAGTA
jgi:hypothetical protein